MNYAPDPVFPMNPEELEALANDELVARLSYISSQCGQFTGVHKKPAPIKWCLERRAAIRILVSRLGGSHV